MQIFCENLKTAIPPRVWATVRTAVSCLNHHSAFSYTWLNIIEDIVNVQSPAHVSLDALLEVVVRAGRCVAPFLVKWVIIVLNIFIGSINFHVPSISLMAENIYDEL